MYQATTSTLGATHNPFIADQHELHTRLAPSEVENRLRAALMSETADELLPPFLRDWLAGDGQPAVCGSVGADRFTIRAGRSFTSYPVLRATGTFAGTGEGSQLVLRFAPNWHMALFDLFLLALGAVAALKAAAATPRTAPLAIIVLVLAGLFALGRYLTWRWFADDEVYTLTRFLCQTLEAEERPQP